MFVSAVGGTLLHLQHPDIYALVAQIPVGVLAFKVGDQSILVIKASARALLSAKSHAGLKLYFAPVQCDGVSTYCLLTAFPDGTNTPNLVWTPLYEDDAARVLLDVLSEPRFDLYLLDEKNRPWLTAVAGALEIKKIQGFLSKLRLPPKSLSRTTVSNVIDQARNWFSHSGSREDRRAFEIAIHELLHPSDLVMLHVGIKNQFYGEHVRHATLEYSHPGDRQEPDLAEEIAKLFGGEKVFLNPLKLPNMEELSDTLATGRLANYFFEFKSSPNTETVAQRDIQRLRTTLVQHVDRALRQTQRCMDYVLEGENFAIALKADRKFHASVPQKDRNAIFVIVTHETIADDLGRYASAILPLATGARKIICHLAETDLYRYLHFCSREEDFFDLLVQDFGYMLQTRKVYDQQHPVLLRLEEHIRRREQEREDI